MLKMSTNQAQPPQQQAINNTSHNSQQWQQQQHAINNGNTVEDFRRSELYRQLLIDAARRRSNPATTFRSLAQFYGIRQSSPDQTSAGTLTTLNMSAQADQRNENVTWNVSGSRQVSVPRIIKAPTNRPSTSRPISAPQPHINAGTETVLRSSTPVPHVHGGNRTLRRPRPSISLPQGHCGINVIPIQAACVPYPVLCVPVPISVPVPIMMVPIPIMQPTMMMTPSATIQIQQPNYTPIPAMFTLYNN